MSLNCPDECTIPHKKKAFEVVDRTLQGFRNLNPMMGNVTVLVPEELNATLKSPGTN